MKTHSSVVLLSSLFLISTAVAQTPQKDSYGYSKMYDDLNPSIVKIEVDSGTGSGFVVSRSGLIATNHHVVRNSRYVAVQFADGRKVIADIVVLNPRYDVAVLKVNSAAVRSTRPLTLLSQDKDSSVKAGCPVVAFGSPLDQTFLITQGIVSKVEDHVLLGDSLIRSGNSGGPLVNLDGDVIGINTFLVRGSLGGIAGAVRIGILRDILKRLDSDQTALEEPSLELLPTLSQLRYPTEVLKHKILNERLDLSAYRFDGGKFVVTVMTPVLVGKMQVQDDLQQASNRYKRRGKKIKDASFQAIDEPFYEWHRTATALLDYAVTFEIKPDFGLTTGSKWAVALSATAAAMGSRNAIQNLHVNMEYKAEFLDFRLYRDGVEILTVTPGRQITETSFDGTLTTFVDEAYSGMYVYQPEVFATGNEFRFDIYDAREPERVHKSVRFGSDSKLIRQIRSDFANTGDATTASDVIMLRSSSTGSRFATTGSSVGDTMTSAFDKMISNAKNPPATTAQQPATSQITQTRVEQVPEQPTEKQPAKTAPKSVTPTIQDSSRDARIGQETTVDFGQSEFFLFAKTLDDHFLRVSAEQKSNVDVYEKLRKSGRLKRVDNHSRVRVVGIARGADGSDVFEITILSSRTTVWIESKFLKHIK